MSQAYYSPFIVQTGQVPSTQTDVPALIYLTDARLKTIGNGGHVANSNGYDIRPYSDSALTTALTYELVFYDAAAGTVELWVKIASLADGSTVYLSYGDAALSSDGSSTSTWETTFKGVWHLPNGSSLTAKDSTSNAKDLTVNAGTTATSGQIDGAATGFDTGSLDGLKIAALVSGGQNTRTVSAWINLSSTNRYGVCGSRGAGSDGWVLDVNRNSPGNLTYFHTGGGLVEIAGGFSTSTWVHVAAVNNTGTVTLFVNGASIGSGGGFVADTSASVFSIGNEGSGQNPLSGSIDEVHVSHSARAANWITTEYNNQSAPSTFWPIGTEVPVSSGGGGPLIGGGELVHGSLIRGGRRVA